MPGAAVIVYGLPDTGLVATAVVDRLGEPVTPDVASVSLFLNPVIVAVSVGFGSPYGRLLLSAVTVRVALPTVSWPLVNVNE